MNEVLLNIVVTDRITTEQWSYDRVFVSLELFLEQYQERYDALYGVEYWSVSVVNR